MAGVFDGMGGLNEGEKVSGAAARTIAQWTDAQAGSILAGDTDAMRESLSEALDDLNAKVRSFSRKNGTESGTTVAILVLYPEGYLTCNVGDSRIYRIGGREVFQLSEDHSLAAFLVKAGVLPPEQAADYPQNNVLMQAVGILEKLTPSFTEGRLHDQDVFLLCSDGFYHCQSDEEYFALARETDRQALTDALRRMIKKAIEKGETDNITGITIKITREG